MTLETVLEFKAGNLHFLPHIRRDPSFPKQLYYISISGARLAGETETSVSLYQGTPNGVNHFFTDQFDWGTGEAEKFTLDEQKNELTVIIDHPLEGFETLKVWKISFEAPDVSGYRPIRVEGSPVLASRPYERGAPIALTICPSNGERIMGVTISERRPRMSSCVKAFYPAKLYDHNTPIKATFLSELQSFEMEARSYVFTRRKDLLVLFSYNPRAETKTGHWIRENCQSRSDNGCMILYSYNDKLKPINTLQIDPVELVRDFLPTPVFEDFLSRVRNGTPEGVFFGVRLGLLGHVHKYVLFSLEHNYFLAAKLPRNWYRLSRVSTILQRRTISVDDIKIGQFADSCLVGTDLYRLSNLRTTVLRKMSLGHELIDYRRCAFCGEQEQTKGRSKEGKRIAKFKVCRLCKQLNFHQYYLDGELACHYCSTECQQKHWKEHKIVHSRAAKERKDTKFRVEKPCSIL